MLFIPLTCYTNFYKTPFNPAKSNAMIIFKQVFKNLFLFLQLEGLENEISQEKQSLQNSQNLSKDLMKEKTQLEKTLEALRENSERQVSNRIKC